MASNISDSSDNMGISNSGNNFYFNGLVNTNSPGVPANYLTWTLTVDAGSQLELTEVKFDYWNEQASGFGVSYALRSSVDGFTSDLASVENYLVSDIATLTADLDALGTTFEGLTGSIDFRIYAYGDVAFNESGERGRLDSIYHSGATTAIPEPGTFGLVTVFGGAVLFIRRRFMIQ
jgi:hypothetical protein